MLHQRKVIIGQVRVPDDTTEVTQVKALLSDVELRGAMVTAGRYARLAREGRRQPTEQRQPLSARL